MSKFLTEVTRLRAKWPQQESLPQPQTSTTHIGTYARLQSTHTNSATFSMVSSSPISASHLDGPALPAFGGVMASAIEHLHGNTNIKSANILAEGAETMSHVKGVEPWEACQPERIQTDVRKKHTKAADPAIFSCTAYTWTISCFKKYNTTPTTSPHWQLLPLLLPTPFGCRSHRSRRNADSRTQDEHELGFINGFRGLDHRHKQIYDRHCTRKKMNLQKKST